MSEKTIPQGLIDLWDKYLSQGMNMSGARHKAARQWNENNPDKKVDIPSLPATLLNYDTVRKKRGRPKRKQ